MLEPCPVCGSGMKKEGHVSNPIGTVERYLYCHKCGLKGFERDLQELSRAVKDAKSIVRCGECKHSKKQWDDVVLCKLESSEFPVNGFCSFGERI